MPADPARYHALDGSEQALMRNAWDSAMTERLAELDFEEQLRAAGAPWPEAARATSSSVALSLGHP